MKNTIASLILSLSFLTIAASAAQAQTVTVAQSEVAFGCDGLTPDLTVQPMLNLSAGKYGEYRIEGSGASRVRLQGSQMIYRTAAGADITIGSLASSPTCDKMDVDDPADPSWNSVNLSKTVVLTLTLGSATTLNIVDLTSGASDQLVW